MHCLIHRGLEVPIIYLAHSNERIAIDRQGNLYWYDLTRSIWRKYESAYDLERAIGYALVRYSLVDQKELASLIEECRQAEVVMTQESFDPEATTDILTQIHQAFHGRSNDLAIQGKMQIGFCLSGNLRDSLNRLNLGVLLCRTATTERRLGKRIAQIKDIQGALRHLHRLVASLIQGFMDTNEHLLKILRSAYSACQDGHGRTVRFCLKQFKTVLENQAVVKPFDRTQRHLREEILLALDLQESGKYEELRLLLKTMGFSLRLKACQARLENLRAEISLAHRFPMLWDESMASRTKKHLVKLVQEELPEIPDSRFVRPVVGPLIGKLKAVRGKLPFTLPADKGQLKQCKQLLEEACELL